MDEARRLPLQHERSSPGTSSGMRKLRLVDEAGATVLEREWPGVQPEGPWPYALPAVVLFQHACFVRAELLLNLSDLLIAHVQSDPPVTTYIYRRVGPLVALYREG